MDKENVVRWFYSKYNLYSYNVITTRFINFSEYFGIWYSHRVNNIISYIKRTYLGISPNRLSNATPHSWDLLLVG